MLYVHKAGNPRRRLAQPVTPHLYVTHEYTLVRLGVFTRCVGAPL